MGGGFPSVSGRPRPSPAVFIRFRPLPTSRHLWAVAHAQASPCTQLRAGTSVQAHPCASVQESPGSGPRASTSVHAFRAPLCRHAWAVARVQALLCRQLRAGTLVQAHPCAFVKACPDSSLRAGTSVQAVPHRHPGAGTFVRVCASMSGQWPMCRCLRAGSTDPTFSPLASGDASCVSVQAPLCRHLCARAETCDRPEVPGCKSSWG